MARKVIGFDVTGMGENLKNAGSVEKPAAGGSSSKGNYNQPGTINKNIAMKAVKGGYIDADGSINENTPAAHMGGSPNKGRGYTK